MIDPCDYCASERVAAVLDKRIEASPTAGNKYRTRCLSCSKWLPMCGAADFQTADHQHVLPRDADPEEEDSTVPVEEYDGPVDGVKEASSDGPPECQEPGCTSDASPATGHTYCERCAGSVSGDGGEVMADGGQVEETDEEPDVNRFDCPECGAGVEGFPEECPECSVPYQWDGQED